MGFLKRSKADTSSGQVPEEVAAPLEDAGMEIPEGGAVVGDPVRVLRASWRRQWQAPAMAAAAVLLASGLAFGVLSRPKARFDGVLDRAERLIERDKFQDALRVLNDPDRGVYPWLARPGAVGPVEQRRYHTLVARAISLGQDALGIELDANNEAVIREYQAAERLGATLSPADIARLAYAYAGRGEADLALARARTIPDGAHALRDDVFRRVVDDWLGSDVPRFDRAEDLLTELLTDPGQTVEQRVWALARQATVQIGQGFPDQAITRLLRAIPRLEGASATDIARLHVLLGQAYLKTGAVREAGRQLEHAIALEPGEDELRAQARVLIARVHESQGELTEARDLYAEVVEQYASTRWYLPALLGLAEAEAGLGQTAASVETYRRLLIDRADPGRVDRRTADPRADAIAQSLLERYLEQATAGEPESALVFAGMAAELFTADTAPPPVLQALADGHRSAAEKLLGASLDDGQAETLDRLALLDPSTRAEVQRHLLRAAAHERVRADRSVLSDNEQFADALWKAAELFDRAGDPQSAAEAFREFAEGVPGSGRQAEARWRLGQAYQVLGDYARAEDQYRNLIEEQRNGVGGAGPIAAKSHVPLAQCLLADADPNNDAEAEQLLLSALDGSLGLTDSQQFHDALLELAGLYYKAGRYDRAVERYDEALARYPDDPRSDSIAYKLADSLRQLAGRIDTALGEPMPDGERQRLIAEARSHRARAQDLFERAVEGLGSTPDSQLTRLEKVQLRNAYFYLGDVAFDMGDFDRAIRAYDAARERYSQDPATLVAMVQIVNAYVEEGDFRRARTAHERARRFYLSLPEDVWDDPLLPMDRKDWERWLDSTSALYRMAGAGGQDG